MIGVAVPRKARSASTKRHHENFVSGNGGVREEPARPSPSPEVGSPSSSNVSVRKKMKPGEGPPPRTRPSKVSESSSEDIEIEIAEVLFGLKKQSQSNKRQESHGNELEPRDTKGSAHDSRSRASRSSPQSDPKFSVGAVEKSSIAAEAEKVESEQQPEKMDTCSPRASSHESLESQQEATLKREDSKLSGIGDEKPISAPPCAESDAVFDDLQNSTKADPAAPEARSKQEEKFEIDLMAPPMAASLDKEDNGFADSISYPKAPVKDEEKVERFVKEVVLEEPEEEKKEKEKEKKKRRRETIGEKRELPKLDLEKPNQDSGSSVRSTSKSQQQQNQSKASIPKVENTSQSGFTPLQISVTGLPGGLPPLGYMPPYQTVVPMDGNTAATTSLQPLQFLLSQPRPKRCTTHHHIARNIHLHQQFSMNNFWPAPAATATPGGAMTSKLSFMPSAEKVIAANPFQGSFPSVNLTSVQEKGQAGTNFPSHIVKDGGSESINLMDSAQRNQALQQAPQAAPAGSSMLGPAFIFPTSQHPAVAAAAAAANQSGLSKPSNPAKHVSLPSNSATGLLGSSSVLPAVTPAVSFNYPNFPPNEAPYMAILQNNIYPFPISTPIGTTTALRGSTPAQTMPFLNGSFYSSQMFHSSQLQQQQPQVQACHQNTSTSSGSSSSHKQPRGAQVGGNNLLGSASMQLQQPHKQHVLPSNQSRKLEVEITTENTPSVVDSQPSHAKESVYRRKNFTVPVQPLNFRLMPPTGLSGSSGGNHGEKQQHGLKGAVELFPSPAFAMSFADFNGNKTAFNGNNMVSTLNFSSLPQNPVTFQSLPGMAQLGYQVTPTPQAAQQKTHQVSEGKSGGGSSFTPNDAKKATSGKPSTTTGQTLVFDNSAKTLSFMSSPVTGNWPPQYVTNGPHAGHTSNSQQQQVLQLQVQQQPASAPRSKAVTSNSLSSSSTVVKFPNNPPCLLANLSVKKYRKGNAPATRESSTRPYPDIFWRTSPVSIDTSRATNSR